MNPYWIGGDYYFFDTWRNCGPERIGDLWKVMWFVKGHIKHEGQSPECQLRWVLTSPLFTELVGLETIAGQWKSGYGGDLSHSLPLFFVWNLLSLGFRSWVRVWTSAEALQIRVLCVRFCLLILEMKLLLLSLIYSWDCFIFILFSCLNWLEPESIPVFQ